MSVSEGIFERHSLSTILLFSLAGTYLLLRLVQFTTSYYRHAKIIREKGCQPYAKYPHSDPIFGLDLYKVNTKLLKEAKFLPGALNRFKTVEGGVNTYSSLLLGATIINTVEPENIKAILATQFKEFQLSPRRKASFNGIFGHGIFTTDGKAWEDSRALLRPNFVRSQVGDVDTFDDHTTKLIARIPRDGSTVDLQSLFFMLTMDSATDFLFGQSTDILSGGDNSRAERFSDAFGYIQEIAGLRSRVGILATLLPNKKYKDDVTFVHEYVQSYVRKAMEYQKQYSSLEKENVQDDGRTSRYIFLEQLAKTSYPAKKLQDELLNILLAGRDTTASLLSQLFYILARRPDVFKKLRAEVVALDNGRPSFEQIKDMKYLRYCLNETLRLYPIVPINNRVAVIDTVLPLGGGPDGKSPIFVKAGQHVSYYPWVMHRRKDFYGEDAEEFKPERWESYRPGWEYLPFNGGPRICIGQQFALTEASYTTIRLLQAFKDIEARDDSEWHEALTLTLAVRNGCKVALTPA